MGSHACLPVPLNWSALGGPGLQSPVGGGYSSLRAAGTHTLPLLTANELTARRCRRARRSACRRGRRLPSPAVRAAPGSGRLLGGGAAAKAAAELGAVLAGGARLLGAVAAGRQGEKVGKRVGEVARHLWTVVKRQSARSTANNAAFGPQAGAQALPRPPLVLTPRGRRSGGGGRRGGAGGHPRAPGGGCSS